MRRRVPTKRSGRRTVAGSAAASSVTLDDRPLSIERSRDGKRLIVVLPYEVWIVNAGTFEVERTIELPSEAPSVFEAEEDGVLWIGGQHLHRGSLFSGAVTKVGSKLGGFVDRVCLLAPTLLCGVGSHGEVLWDTESETAIHRRKAGEHAVLGLARGADGRAVWLEGVGHAWVVDPDHPSGYMKLPLKTTSEHDVAHEAVVRLGLTSDGLCVLAAADGGVGWTNRVLRLVEERFPKVGKHAARPLDVCGDARWIYVLRSGGLLHRFLIAQPEGDDAEELPLAQACGLDRRATCIALGRDGTLVLGGPHDDMGLGRLWTRASDALSWEELRLGGRRLVETEPEAPRKAPSFVATRSKIEGTPLREVTVDHVLAIEGRFAITSGSGTILDRPVASSVAGDVKPADAVLLPAMVRLREGTARPALLLWPGAAGDDVREPTWLVWGDAPRSWTPLRTPQIREQGWTRRDVFPLEVALGTRPPDVPGTRAEIPASWHDAERFSALAQECKHLLKVLW